MIGEREEKLSICYIVMIWCVFNYNLKLNDIFCLLHCKLVIFCYFCKRKLVNS